MRIGRAPHLGALPHVVLFFVPARGAGLPVPHSSVSDNREVQLGPVSHLRRKRQSPSGHRHLRKARVPLGDVEVSTFEDGEVSVRFNENIRGSDVFIVQSTNAPADYPWSCSSCSTPRSASAWRVTAVMLYFGYARQDRGTSALRADHGEARREPDHGRGRRSALTMDLHSAQIRGFFDIPLDHLYAAPVFIDYFSKM